MRMQQEFHLNKDRSVVWKHFQDVAGVVDCLPGAELTEQVDDQTYRGQITTKLGPVTVTFEGEVVITPNPQDMTGTLKGQGVDKKGGSRGEIIVDYRLDGSGADTIVEMDADVKLSGAVARFGRAALLEEVTRRLMVDFTNCLEERLAGPHEDHCPQLAEPGVAEPSELRGISLIIKSASSATWNTTVKFFPRLWHRLIRRS